VTDLLADWLKSLHPFWALVSTLLVVMALATLGFLLFSPARLVAASPAELPVVLHSDLQANYERDERPLPVQPVEMRLIEQTLKEEPGGAQQFAALMEDLDAPVPVDTALADENEPPQDEGGPPPQLTPEPVEERPTLDAVLQRPTAAPGGAGTLQSLATLVARPTGQASPGANSTSLVRPTGQSTAAANATLRPATTPVPLKTTGSGPSGDTPAAPVETGESGLPGDPGRSDRSDPPDRLDRPDRPDRR